MGDKILYHDEAKKHLEEYIKLKKQVEEMEVKMEYIRECFDKWLEINSLSEYTFDIEDETWKVEKRPAGTVNRPNWVYLETILTKEQMENAIIKTETKPYVRITRIARSGKKRKK